MFPRKSVHAGSVLLRSQSAARPDFSIPFAKLNRRLPRHSQAQFPPTTAHPDEANPFTTDSILLRKGSTIRKARITPGNNSNFPLNVPAKDSWMDVRWLKDNTTVQRSP